MARDNIICGLDVGTSNIRAVVAQLRAGHDKPQILGVSSVPSFGVRKGVIVDIGEVVNGIKTALKEVERTSDASVRQVVVNIGGSHINCRSSKGVVAVSRADGEISGEDISRAVRAAQTVSIPQNRELIHALPRLFVVDEERGVKDPIGMSGVRLEADVLLVEGATPFIKNLTKCLQEAEIEAEDVVLSALAASRAVLSKRQKELGVLLLDLGGGTSGLTVFEECEVLHACVLPIGGSHITNDIAIGLRTSVEVADRIKLEYGSTLPEEINKKDIIDMAKLGEEEGVVLRRHVADIINARFLEIFDLVGKELQKIGRDGLLPAGLVLVGGGAKMPGLVDLAKEELKLPAQIGFPSGVDGVINQIDDPAFATAVGLVLWGAEEQRPEGRGKRISLPASGFLSSAKKWLKGFVP